MISGKKCTVTLAVSLTLALLFTFCFTYLPAFTGMEAAAAHPAYETKLFGSDLVSIDIRADADEWQEMLDNATAEAYISCDVVVNGTLFTSVGVRPKGNTSLTSVAGSDSDRYSFKLEFDHYVDGQTCFGLDKFVVNNIQSDATYMKEYLSYQMMDFLDVPSSLCSFADLSVNGETWGLYLAIEALEESYAARNFGTDYGQLYKPDSQNNRIGGMDREDDNTDGNANGFSGGRGDRPGFGGLQGDTEDGQYGSTDRFGGGFGGRGLQPPGGSSGDTDAASGATEMPGNPPDMHNGTGGGFPGGMPGSSSGGGSDLVYTDSEEDSYSDIFSSAVFSSDSADHQRVITALEHLSEGDELEKYIDVDEVLRYFAVNTVLVNLDSYAGNLKHNYYLYEEDGRLSILPWDFNLAFGGFQGGSASSAVNFPIDTPVSGTTLEERPLIGKLLEVEAYKESYHGYLQELVTGYFDSGLFASTIESLDGLIGELVQNDPTAFYTYDQYQTALVNLEAFGTLRAASIQGQLDGSIPSTSEGQAADASQRIDASSVNLSAMGSQGGGMDGDMDGNPASLPDGGGQFGQGGNMRAGGLPDRGESEAAGGGRLQNGLLLGGSVLLLGGGILFIVFYPRRRRRNIY